MVEVELKIALDAGSAAALRRSAGLAALRDGPLRASTLSSVYYDTPDHDLAAAGIVLRVRRDGRHWLQTIKKRRGALNGGLSAPEEEERALPQPLPLLDPTGPLAEEVAALARGTRLAPVFGTEFRRSRCLLRLPSGAVVELAIDAGELRAGARAAPLHEAELELKQGAPAAVYEAASLLFPTGPIHFSREDKASQAGRLAGFSPPRLPAQPADPGTPVGTVRAAALAGCLDQIAEGSAATLASDSPEGPHQMRIGLRRLRTALSVFPPLAGTEADARIGALAQRLGQVAGRLRDLDVLCARIADPEFARGLDAGARAALLAAVTEWRQSVRAEVREEIAGREATGFLFRLGQLSLSGQDNPSAARPVGPIARAGLDHALARALHRGKGLASLSVEQLHDLRKALKKLRYATEFLAPLTGPHRVGPFVAALKRLQDQFGALNDAAMATVLLGAADAPGRGDAEAQRAAGWIMGALDAEAGDCRRRIATAWKAFRGIDPFWR